MNLDDIVESHSDNLALYDAYTEFKNIRTLLWKFLSENSFLETLVGSYPVRTRDFVDFETALLDIELAHAIDVLSGFRTQLTISKNRLDEELYLCMNEDSEKEGSETFVF